MAASVLTPLEQKSSLSGKKKKKKVVKNVLGLPKSLKVESVEIDTNEADKLSKILERLLPPARLPVQRNPRFSKGKNINGTPEELRKKEEAKKRRNQLSLGVNEVNKSIKKQLISAVLLADDIQPKFLIHHLNLLCNHNKVPFLHMPGQRDVTKNCLGFPCIAIGFKKDFCDFLEIISEIKSIYEVREKTFKETEECEMESSESDSDETEQDTVECNNENKTPFTYLYRSSRKERIFIPGSDVSNKKTERDFIGIDDDDEGKTQGDVHQSGISSSLVRKQKIMNLDDFNYSGSDDEEDLSPPKKKNKKAWVIDTVGTKRKFKYSPANLMRVHSNPDRLGKKCKRN